MSRLIMALVLLLAVLHHDFWLWHSTTLVFGFLPSGLAYHMAFSVAAGLVWLLAIKYAWPNAQQLSGQQGKEPRR